MKKPNVIIVITDDQGYGDLGCTGNPWLKTPALDAFYGDSARFTDFHVRPLCSPTRAALMTGVSTLRNGVWGTTMARSLLNGDLHTMADAFGKNGYRTGLFGKWHLGDNYPFRPQDRGFDTVLWHKGGGVGQTPDFWGNNYFDDTYFSNDKNKERWSYSGYCTDIWFGRATKFIEECVGKNEPFFAYISTNAPHDPYLVDEKYAQPYKNNPDISCPEFYGMIANIDENFDSLRARLKELSIEDDTVLIFMTDNGTSAGCQLSGSGDGFVIGGYNAGMRGLKGSYFDGGHRVPLFVRWPNGGIRGGWDIDEFARDIDILPTLVSLCQLDFSPGYELDGGSLISLINGEVGELPGERLHFLQWDHTTTPPDKWNNAVLTKNWRLIRGAELYDIKQDPGQRHDVSKQYPGIVQKMRSFHEKNWEAHQGNLSKYNEIVFGNDAENPVALSAMDVCGDGLSSQLLVAAGRKTGDSWAVRFERPGRYRFALRRWPEESDVLLCGAITEQEAKKLASPPQHSGAKPLAIDIERAVLRLLGNEYCVKTNANDVEAVFTVEIAECASCMLSAGFIDKSGEYRGAYYVYVYYVHVEGM